MLPRNRKYIDALMISSRINREAFHRMKSRDQAAEGMIAHRKHL